MSSELDWVDQLKVVDLRKRLKELGENTSGKKAILAERLKAKLSQQDETPEDVAEVEDKMDEDKKETEEEESEKKAVKTGLNELLGDGTGDLEFDFETEKPTRKKQKTAEAAEKVEQQPSTDPKSTEPKSQGPKTTTPEKAALEEDLVDFETPQPTEGKEMPTEPQPPPGEEIQRTASAAEAMEVEAPAVAEEDRTAALRIQNFVRPFTEKAAKEMLSSFGAIEDMWMPAIKTHCFVLYSNAEEAHNAYLGTFNVVWPRSGKRLQSHFVAVEEAKKAMEDGRSRALYARASGSASYQKNRHPVFVQSSRTPHGNAPLHGPPARTSSKPALSLEDLFCKTQSKPPIYYLPLTDEQVAEKKRLAQEKESQSAKPPAEESAKDG